MGNTIEILKFSTDNGCLFGTWGYVPVNGSDGVRSPVTGYLGSTEMYGTVTGALRQFNLPTSRAPGDWPEHAVNVVRY